MNNSADDMSMQAIHGNRSSCESAVKREELKDDDLLFAQLDTITDKLAANSSDYSLAQSIDLVSQMQQMSASILDNPFQKSNQVSSTGVTDHFDNINKLSMCHETPNFLPISMDLNKLPIEFSNMTETSMQSIDGGSNGTTHYVKYKLQDGKHVKVWECGTCAKEFTHQYTLMRHLPTHTDERKFQCNTCGKAFRQMSTLSQHRAIHSTERPYVCEICQKTFNRVSTLISHRKTHTGLKPHRCHMCKKSFHQKGNLRNHIFTHTNERPYKCDICDKGFNQMSNLMCHKMKAHQRAEKPKYACQICGMCFLKRMGLRHHEQFTHGMVNSPAAQTPTTDKLNYMNAIFVDPIKTEAMRLAVESNQTPFALLRPVTGIPVLVRVLPAGDKQMLVPASADDLKKHSHISITMKEEQAKESAAKVGSTVQIKIPVVATVIQQNDTAGQMSMSVVSPGPNGELSLATDQSDIMNSKTNSFVYSSSLTNHDATTDDVVGIEDIPLSSSFDANEIINGVNIEFLDENGRRVGEKDFPAAPVSGSSDILYQDSAVTSTNCSSEMLSPDGIDLFLNKNFPDSFRT